MSPPPPPFADRPTVLACVNDRPSPHPRSLRVTGRTHRRSRRGCSYSPHFLLRPTTPSRPPARPRRGTAVVGRVADTARSLCTARPHRAVAHGTAFRAGRRARTLPQHREPRAATARRPEPHLPQRLRGAALARQDPAHLRADRAGLQRPAPAEEGPPQRGCRGRPRLVRRRPAPTLPAPSTAGGPVGSADATGGATTAGAPRAPDTTHPIHPARCGRRLLRGHCLDPLRGARRCRAPQRAARAARSSPREDHRAASRDPRRNATRSTPRRVRPASRGRSTRPSRGRRGAA